MASLQSALPATSKCASSAARHGTREKAAKNITPKLNQNLCSMQSLVKILQTARSAKLELSVNKADVITSPAHDATTSGAGFAGRNSRRTILTSGTSLAASACSTWTHQSVE